MPGAAPRATLDNPYGPLVTFRTEDVLPPSALYLSMDDTLVALFSVGLAGTTFTMTVRMLLPDGMIQVEEYFSTTPLGPLMPSIVLPPVEGYLLSIAVIRTDTVNCNSWCLAALYKGAVTQPLTTLPTVAGAVIVQGEVDELSYLSWPNSPAAPSGTGAGTMRSVALPNPTGSDWSVGPGANQRWSVITVTFNLVTTAAAGNRQMTLAIYDQAGNGVGRCSSAATQPPNSGCGYTFFRGSSNAQLGPVFMESVLPDELMLDPYMKIGSSVQNMNAGDAFSQGRMLVREWMGVGHP